MGETGTEFGQSTFAEAINFERRTICQMSTRTKVVFHKKKKSDVCT